MLTQHALLAPWMQQIGGKCLLLCLSMKTACILDARGRMRGKAHTYPRRSALLRCTLPTTLVSPRTSFYRSVAVTLQMSISSSKSSPPLKNVPIRPSCRPCDSAVPPPPPVPHRVVGERCWVTAGAVLLLTVCCLCQNWCTVSCRRCCLYHWNASRPIRKGSERGGVAAE